MEVPLRVGNHVEWRMIEEFDTVDPVVDELADDYFGTIVEEFLLTEGGQQGMIGSAPSVLLSAPAVVSFAVRWLEQRYR